MQLDQRDPAAIAAAVDSVVREFGRVDILVNNAAWNIGIPFTDLDTLTADFWDRVLETNLRVRICWREHALRTCVRMGQAGS